MPEARKISELPTLTSVGPNDIVPIVDAALTQTSKVEAYKIAQLGGGPPGTNTVSTDKLQNGAVTVPKLGFSGPNLLTTRVAAGAGAGDTEFACTAWARGLLAKPNAGEAYTYVGANPTFSGPVFVPYGSAGAPSYSFTESPTTGLFAIDDSVAVSCGGVLRYLFSQAGNMYSVPAGGTELVPALPIRCFAVFTNAIGASTFTLNRARTIGELLGYKDFVAEGDTSGPCIWNSTTAPTAEQSLAAALTARGLIYVAHGAAQYDNRTNYTTPGDNHLIQLDANGAFVGYVRASNKTWVGSLTYQTPGSASILVRNENISSVTPAGGGVYTLNFWAPLPDTNYAVFGSAQSTNTLSFKVVSKTASSCVVQFIGTAVAGDVLTAIVVR